jgi:hypothetical protein
MTNNTFSLSQNSFEYTGLLSLITVFCVQVSAGTARLESRSSIYMEAYVARMTLVPSYSEYLAALSHNANVGR